MAGYNRRDDYADTCPFCNADLRGEPIPEASRHWYGEKAERFSRLIGIVENDRVVRWKCPDCGKEWPRRFD